MSDPIKIGIQVTLDLPSGTVSATANGTPVAINADPSLPVPAPLPLPAPVVTDPPAPIDPPAPVTVPEPTVTKLHWYSPKHLVKVLNWMGLQVADGAKHFYKFWSFWIFAILGAVPDLYDMAVSMKVVDLDKIPPEATQIVHMIAFLGAAVHLVERKKTQPSS